MSLLYVHKALPTHLSQPLCEVVSLVLQSGFLTSDNDVSIRGWEIVLGYTDEEDNWNPCASRKVDDCHRSSEFCFRVNLDNVPLLKQANANLELKVYDSDAHETTGMLIRIDDLPWTV